MINKTQSIVRKSTLAACILASLAFAPNVIPQEAPNLTAIWWNPIESGWGLNINQQGGTIFAAWYTYGSNNEPLWLVASDVKRNASGAFAGKVFRTTGVPLAQINGDAIRSVAEVGNLTLTPNADGGMQFGYQVVLGGESIRAEKQLTKYIFAAPPNCRSIAAGANRMDAKNYQDIWWNDKEPGWGLNVIHQEKIIFLAWYSYNEQGEPLWYTANITKVEGAERFTGFLYRTKGRSISQINGAPAIIGTPEEAGRATLDFANGENATMTYTIGGATQTKTITRFNFAQPATVCEQPVAPPPPMQPPQLPPTQSAELFDWLKASNYKMWAAEANIHPAASPHPTRVRSYANAALEQSIKAKNTTHPMGSAVVKEIYNNIDQLTGWAVMVKTQPASDGGRGWYWYENLNTTTNTPVAASNGSGLCQGCHSAGTDFIRTRFPF